MKIVTVVGARPQFIKASLLSSELAARGIDECLVHTGQHYDHNMSKVFFDGLKMKEPNHFLGVGSASHASQTAAMMVRLEPILQAEHPDWVVVYGDTNTTLAAALVAAKLQIPLAHVEAGLRSFNRQMPEELNRIVSDHLANAHFAPTALAVQHLADEGITENVYRVGDLMVDLVSKTTDTLPEYPAILKRFGLTRGQYGIATVHRAANTDNAQAFARILEGLKSIGFPIVFPVHPRTLPIFNSAAQNTSMKNIVVCEPLPYADMIALQARARVIVTDSGGIQKEALTLQVPCVTLRDETEWIETLVNGWNFLAGTAPELIVRYATRARPTIPPGSYYGEGHSARLITDALVLFRGRREAVAS